MFYVHGCKLCDVVTGVLTIFTLEVTLFCKGVV